MLSAQDTFITLDMDYHYAIIDFFNQVITSFGLDADTDDDVAVVLVGHFVSTLPYLLKLIEQTKNMQIAAIIQKQQDTKPSKQTKKIRKWLEENNYLDRCKDIDRDRLASPGVSKEFLRGIITSEKKKLLIIDIGGYFAPQLQEISDDELIAKNLIGIVEDTQNGEDAYCKTIHASKFPVISIARSRVKKYEDRYVGRTIVEATDKVLKNTIGINIENRTFKNSVGVIGFGKIGKSIVKLLLAKGISPMIYDINENLVKSNLRYRQYFSDKETLLKKTKLLFLATGNHCLSKGELKIIGTEKDKRSKASHETVYLASCTSSEKELGNFAELGLVEDETKKVKSTHYYNTDGGQGRGIYFLHNANAINFLEGSINEWVNAVLASLVLQARRLQTGEFNATDQNYTKIYREKKADDDQLISMYLEKRPYVPVEDESSSESDRYDSDLDDNAGNDDGYVNRSNSDRSALQSNDENADFADNNPVSASYAEHNHSYQDILFKLINAQEENIISGDLIFRKKAIDDLESIISKQVEAKQSAAIAVIAGKAGIGKTTLAAQYLKRCEDDDLTVHRFDATNSETLAASYRHLADKLGIEQEARTRWQNLRNAIIKRLGDKKFVILFDNASISRELDIQREVAEFEQKVNGQIIITSRSSKIRLQKAHHLELQVLSDVEVLTYFRETTKIEPNEYAVRICAKLQGLPFLVVRAAKLLAVLRTSDLDIYRKFYFDVFVNNKYERILQMLKDRLQELTGERVQTVKKKSKEQNKKSRAATLGELDIDTSLKTEKDLSTENDDIDARLRIILASIYALEPDELRLLFFSAYLAKESIPDSLLNKFFETINSADTLFNLKELKFLEIPIVADKDQDIASSNSDDISAMHAIIQEIVQVCSQDFRKDMLLDWFRAINAYYSELEKSEQNSDCYLRYIELKKNMEEMYNFVEQDLDCVKDAASVTTVCDFLYNLIYIHNYITYTPFLTQKYFNKAINICLNRLCKLVYAENEYRSLDAIIEDKSNFELSENVIKIIRVRQLEHDVENYSFLLNDDGLFYLYLVKENAISLYQLEKGDNQLRCINSIKPQYKVPDYYSSKSKELLKNFVLTSDILQTSLEKMLAYHSVTNAKLHNEFGRSLRAMHNEDETQRQSLEHLESAIYHHNYAYDIMQLHNADARLEASILINLAKDYVDKSDFTEALKWWEKADNVWKNHLESMGKDNITCEDQLLKVEILRGLAGAYNRDFQTTVAGQKYDDMYQEIYPKHADSERETALEQKYPQRLMHILNELSYYYYMRRNADAASDCIGNAARLYELGFGKAKTREQAFLKNQQGLVAKIQGNWLQAGERFEQARVIYKEISQENNSKWLARFDANLADVKIDLCEFETAEKLLNNALTIRREIYSQEHIEIVRTQHYFAKLYFCWADFLPDNDERRIIYFERSRNYYNKVQNLYENKYPNYTNALDDARQRLQQIIIRVRAIEQHRGRCTIQ